MAFADDLKALAQTLKDRIDLNELAERLGLVCPGSKSGPNRMYKSPHHEDESPSVSVFQKNGHWGWKDWSGDDGGDCISLVQFVHGGEPVAAMKLLCEWYGVPWPKDGQPVQRVEKTWAEIVAERCLASPLKAMEYLTGERKILEWVAERAVKSRAVGWNDYTSDKKEPGEMGYGGPAAAFIVRTLNPGRVVAVDMRYADAALNGGQKTGCQGEKNGYGWTSDLERLRAAKIIYIVESPINALSIECANLPGVAAFALRGVANIDSIDWAFFCRGKQVFIACDHTDEPKPDTLPNGKRNPLAGIRPGLQAAWKLHEKLTSLDISAMLVDMWEWEQGWDINDFLKEKGPEELKVAVQKIETSLIPGLPAKTMPGKKRLFLPPHHWAKYDNFRVKPDFTNAFIIKEQKTADGDVIEVPTYQDVAGFRVAGISRVRVQGVRSTLTGDPDSQPVTKFAVTVQASRHNATLVRRVFDDESLYNIERWKKFGAVYNQTQFFRMLNILECGIDIGDRKAANFIGLCWLEGRMRVNEGSDCFFEDPTYQCHYHNLIFPSGPVSNARLLIEKWQATFKRNAALMLLTWTLGAHLKAFLRFWPHAEMQADKGSGKSFLTSQLSGAVAVAVMSRQTLGTEYRMVNSVAYTSHPVVWDEFSRLCDFNRKTAVDMLQDTYRHLETTRSKVPFLLSAPVMVVGEDTPGLNDLAEKLVRISILKKNQGPELELGLPQFPVRQWLQWLAELSPAQVLKTQAEHVAYLKKHCSVLNADRMVANYAALLTAWKYLAEFAGYPDDWCDMPRSIVAEMNEHLTAQSSDRHPWVWIMQTLLSEIAAGNFKAPYKFDFIEVEGEALQQPCLFVRTSDVMHHLKTTSSLRTVWEEMPVKSDRIFKSHLVQAGVVVGEAEKTIGSKRIGHMPALSLKVLKEFGLHATLPDDMSTDF